MRTSSSPRPKRPSDTAVSSSRVVNVNGVSSAVFLWRSQDSPARTASVANPTASALPTGPDFTGRAWPLTVGLFPRRTTRSLLASKEAPHEPQKQFCGGLACRHRGHGAWLIMAPSSSSLSRSSSSHFTPTSNSIPARAVGATGRDASADLRSCSARSPCRNPSLVPVGHISTSGRGSLRRRVLSYPRPPCVLPRWSSLAERSDSNGDSNRGERRGISRNAEQVNTAYVSGF